MLTDRLVLLDGIATGVDDTASVFDSIAMSCEFAHIAGTCRAIDASFTDPSGHSDSESICTGVGEATPEMDAANVSVGWTFPATKTWPKVMIRVVVADALLF